MTWNEVFTVWTGNSRVRQATAIAAINEFDKKLGALSEMKSFALRHVFVTY